MINSIISIYEKGYIAAVFNNFKCYIKKQQCLLNKLICRNFISLITGIRNIAFTKMYLAASFYKRIIIGAAIQKRYKKKKSF